jgi:ABC-type taurine transport system ATPase subunit
MCVHVVLVPAGLGLEGLDRTRVLGAEAAAGGRGEREASELGALGLVDVELRRAAGGAAKYALHHQHFLHARAVVADRRASAIAGERPEARRHLAVNPEVLLMDEPFSALDAQTREIMQTELVRIWSDGRKTVLFITHQIDEAVYLSDRVVVFSRRPGRISEIVKVDLPRPRSLSIKRQPEFAAYVDRVWQLIEDDVRASVLSETAVGGSPR